MSLQKYILILIVGMFSLILSGCSLGGAKERMSSMFDTIQQKDAAYQNRGSVDLTQEGITERYSVETGGVGLSNAGLTQIPDLCGLIAVEDHTAIKAINLSNNSIKVFDQDLSCFENLEELNLSYNGATDLVQLGDLPALTTLKLHKNELTTTATISTAGSFPILEDLNVGYNNLTELAGIENLTSLITLEAFHNQLESLVGVERLEKLDELKVEFNKLTSGDVEQLLETKAIEFITAKGNSITEGLLEQLTESNNAYMEQLKEKLSVESLIRQGAKVFEINADGEAIEVDPAAE